MHIDIHGKMDRRNNMDIDLGIIPLHVEWPDEE
jgi:hypothetical protein